ncbi:hypothetical protein Syun_023807 [Stephania yunnanensis]|uniref:Uncharacterized protein n=1 Tax=Stephania yunnanensis TaxID=152371 RepID=A0AAP0F9P3_9MAGN
MKAALKMSFSEDISRLIKRGNRRKLNNASNQVLTDEVTIILNVFCSLMKNIIVRNLDRTLIVAMHNGSKVCIISIFSSNQRSRSNSEVASARARYSDSMLERDLTVCFLLHQDINELPKKKQ